MKNLSNEYEDLLQYLENQETKKKDVVPTSTKSIRKGTKVEVLNKTRHLIEESKDIHADVPLDVRPQSSAGFDVSKFESLMRSRLIDEHKRLQSYERPYISVGELFNCIRGDFYNRQRYPVDVKKQFSFSYLYLIREVGNTIHTVVQSLYDFAEVEKTVVSERYKVKGRADAVKGEFLYEIKSIEKLEKKTYNKEHYFQGLVYACILNNEYNYNIKTITILYVLRNLKNVFPFDLPMDNELADSFLKRSSVLQSSLVSKKVPEPIGSSEEQCRYCLYKKFCERDKTEIIQPFKKSKDDTQKESVFLL